LNYIFVRDSIGLSDYLLVVPPNWPLKLPNLVELRKMMAIIVFKVIGVTDFSTNRSPYRTSY